MDSNKLIISPQWPDCFPASLRVLVVDDDPTHSNILQNMLAKCNYEVTTCNLMQEALDLLQEAKDGFDIIISDVKLRDMDGFKLLEHCALRMQIPMLMMSDDGETSKVMRGLQQGACNYLLKPVRIEEFQNILQDVVSKKLLEARDSEGQKSCSRMTRNGTTQSDNEKKIIKDVYDKGHDRVSCGGPSSMKKARVVWTADLHQKFVEAVNQIGLDKAGPKKILDLMEVSWLTRENVASHLQKYRLHLRRLQKENELKASSTWMKLSDISSVDHNVGNVGSSTMQQHVLTNGITSMLMPTTHMNASLGDVTYFPTSSSTSRINFNRFIGPLDPEEVKSESNNVPCYHLEHNHYNHGPSTGEADFTPFCNPNICFDDGIGKVTYSMAHNREYNNLESSVKNLIVGTSQGDFYHLNQDELVNIGSFGCSDQELVADPRQTYDSVNCDFEYLRCPLECLGIDQGMYIS